jgi:hypothetical protein
LLIVLGFSDVLVDHAFEEGTAPDWCLDWDDGGRVVLGWVLVEALMWPVRVEMVNIVVEHCPGVLLVVDQETVGAFFADAADESFRVEVRSACSGGDFDCVDAFGGEDGVEGGGEFRVAVADGVPLWYARSPHTASTGSFAPAQTSSQ